MNNNIKGGDNNDALKKAIEYCDTELEYLSSITLTVFGDGKYEGIVKVRKHLIFLQSQPQDKEDEDLEKKIYDIFSENYTDGSYSKDKIIEEILKLNLKSVEPLYKEDDLRQKLNNAEANIAYLKALIEDHKRTYEKMNAEINRLQSPINNVVDENKMIELINELSELKKHHIMPYNLGEQGRIAAIIDELHKSTLSSPINPSSPINVGEHKEINVLKRQVSNYKRLYELAKKFKDEAEKKAFENHAAKISLDSEREMNAILTEENERLQSLSAPKVNVNEAEAKDWRQELFSYLSKEHGLILLQEEMYEIENIINPKKYPYTL